MLDDGRRMLGIIATEELRLLSSEPELLPLVNAADLMRVAVSVRLDDDLRTALDAMVVNGIRQVPVTDAEGRFVGLVDEVAIAKAYLDRQRTVGHADRDEA